MVNPLVAPVVLTAKGGGDAVINFQEVSISEVESASWALPPLCLEQLCLLVIHEWMLVEPLGPVQEVPVVGAGSSFDLHVVLAVRFRMAPDIDRFWVSHVVLAIRSKSGPCLNSDVV